MKDENGVKKNGARIPGPPTFTNRQREILGLVRDGFQNRQIGERLQISPSVVKRQLEIISDKLGTFSRTEAVTAAIDKGIISPE